MRGLIFILAATILPVTSVLAQIGNSYADLVEKLQPSVVNISTTNLLSEETEEQDENLGIISSNPVIQKYFAPQKSEHTSLGSGFVIDEKGYILTNNHVIENAKEIWVTLADESRLQAKLVGADSKTDSAIIKIDSPKSLTPVKLGDSDKIRVGDWIVAIGNPFGLGGSVTAGIVSAKSRDIEAGSYDNFIQTDASINQGSSGGPMFDMNGEVIGVNTAIFSTSGGSMGIGFATPINLLKFVIEEIKSKGKVERGWLGIRIQPQSRDMASSIAQKVPSGVMISSVSEDSAAQKAGIEAGDVIIALNEEEVLNPKEFSRKIAETSPGQKIKLDIWRNSQVTRFDLIVEKMPEENKHIAKQQTNLILPQNNLNELGLELEELTPELIDKYQFSEDANGVIVKTVLSGSDAEAKGLRSGDLITQMDKKAIFDLNDVKTYIEEAKKENNRPVLLLINNNNLPHFAAVRLTKHE
ncbi:MAG: Do family serine endopeptidase [Alphaproteobacteria bacterium]|nr:Do family serine endopeptidase [Alphaproteobacteria bacterium]